MAYELTEWSSYNANDEIGVDAPVFIDGWSANCAQFAMRIGIRQNTVVYVFNIDKESHQSFCQCDADRNVILLYLLPSVASIHYGN